MIYRHLPDLPNLVLVVAISHINQLRQRIPDLPGLTKLNYSFVVHHRRTLYVW